MYADIVNMVNLGNLLCHMNVFLLENYIGKDSCWVISSLCLHI